MAVVATTTKMVAGVKYTHTTADSADWASVSNSTYFYDIATEIVYFKDSNGIVQDKFKYVPSIQTTTSTATLTPTSADDLVQVTAQAEALTISNPTGTYADGQNFLIRVYDNGTARAITYGAKFRTLGDTLPATTVVGEWTYIGCTYNLADDKFDTIANSGSTSSIAWGDITGTLSNQTDLMDALNEIIEAVGTKTDKLITENAQSGGVYTLQLSDADKLVSMDNANANTLVIPLNSSVAFPIGTQILVKQAGVGLTTFFGFNSNLPTGGVTIESYLNRTISLGQFSLFTLIKTDTNTWSLGGNLS